MEEGLTQENYCDWLCGYDAAFIKLLCPLVLQTRQYQKE